MSDITDFKRDLLPKSGSTAIRDSFVPIDGDKFYDTTQNTDQVFNGTNWVEVAPKNPPREGAIGLAASAYFRLSITRLITYWDAYGTGAPGTEFDFGVPSLGYAQTTFTPTSVMDFYAPILVDVNGLDITQPMSNVASTSVIGLDGTTANGIIQVLNTSVPALIDLTFPSPVTPTSFRVPYNNQANATISTVNNNRLLSYELLVSYDAGLTWSSVYIINEDPYVGGVSTANKPLSVPTFPPNPSMGQRFRNLVTGLSMKWDGSIWTQDYAAENPITPITANYNIHSFERVFVDTTLGPITITLPVGKEGSYVTFYDASGTMSTNNLSVITSNTETIMLSTAPLVISVSNKTIKLGFYGTNWVVL